MLKKIIASGIAMSFFTMTFAQDSATAHPLTITGVADVYYKYDFGETKLNSRTSFTGSHNTFELGMASVKLDYKTGKTEMVADLGFGKRAKEFSYTDDGITQAIKQLYISYSLAPTLKLTAGTWATHVGYELVDPNLNRNYSMSYMFTNGPFTHTGVKAEASFGANGFMVGVANPTDFRYVPDGKLNRKAILAQYSFTGSDKFKAYVNFVGGQNLDTSKSNQFDLVVTSKFSSMFSIGLNGTINLTKAYLGNKTYADGKSWWGAAAYINVDPTSTFGLTLREEYFSDENSFKVYSGLGFPNGGTVFGSTLSANIRTSNLIFIPEIRVDNASQTIFLDNESKATKTAANFLLAVVYQF